MKEISIADKNELDSISIKIRDNTANVQEYNRYEDILIKSGFDRNEIKEKLTNINLSSWQDLINARNNAKTYEDKKKLEIGVVSFLIGLSLALTFFILAQTLKLTAKVAPKKGGAKRPAKNKKSALIA